MSSKMSSYVLLLSDQTAQLLAEYKMQILSNELKPSFNLKVHLQNSKPLPELTNEEFLQLLLLTKKITCFAESEISGDGSDWNPTELRILGDVSVAMSAMAFDNGVWDVHEKTFKTHDPPVPVKLIFTPGPLLHGSRFRSTTPDFDDISDHGQISQVRYNAVIERRLLPAFLYANETAKQEGRKALLVLPGLGCGQFAGKFHGKMGEHLNQALQAILKKFDFENIACVRFDPYSECVDFEQEIKYVKYRVRLNVGPLGKSQLCHVRDYEETQGEFEGCILYKIVAWDHASLPGNDYFLGCRTTDDGVTAAATNSMELLTGVVGSYSQPGYFMPPAGTGSWRTVASKNKTRLLAEGNIKVALGNGLVELS
ncbi:uncharacterized protein LOC129000884 [Macrosteles quadrilineatus]|uniref:uncharacterized protein LOC129000884 n=1 Tax=Macrosteles quadrilineatus TaxID=74068 RepID=UPI0023E28644|nr:uncharacterized protein LOC129000884 [Macrosteles quadrilineatus]